MRPSDRKYTKSHEWVLLEGDTAKIGITDFAVDELCSGNEGDLVYCDLPDVGRALVAGETFGEIESVKAVSDLDTRFGGEILAVNPEIEEHLEVLAKDPFTQGWMIQLKVTDTSPLNDLLDAEAYESHISAEQH